MFHLFKVRCTTFFHVFGSHHARLHNTWPGVAADAVMHYASVCIYNTSRQHTVLQTTLSLQCGKI